MVTSSIQRLSHLCNTVPALLAQISENDFSWRPGPGKWSKKEIVGHLIDSAANNHQRFVRVQFEDNPVIFYDSDQWVANSYYQEMGREQLISFWEAYNRHLIELVKRIPENKSERLCNTNNAEPVSLRWLVDDYVSHMEHHLEEIFSKVEIR